MNELFATADDTSSDTSSVGQSALFADIEPPKDVAAGYRVLARKYRPSTFEQLIGQEAMVRTLANAIAAGRLPHAWILTGVRGIGKTTTARIIARALNCTGKDGENKGPTIQPCGVCDTCRAIAEDRHVDVMEMDAASRTGVDDIREIVDGVRYGPASARYKVYILDEVHMLSKNAFNALLKTLEEPPPHTKFIFATTEIRKVPVTVLSRCQRFDLRRIDSDMLTNHFTQIVEWEKVTAEPDALRMIAHAADGSVRDGLSLLDQAIARGNGSVNAVDVKDMLGLADRGHSMTLCRDILRGNIKEALATFGVMQQAGSDPLQCLQDLSDLVHMLTRGQAIPSFATDATLPEYDHQLLTELSDIKIPALTRAWQILLKGLNEVQGASHPAQAAEMVLIRLAYAADLPLPGDLIKQIKDGLASGALAAQSQPNGGGNGGGTRALAGGGGGGSVVQAIARQAVPQAEVVAQTGPTNYRDLVNLFIENREATLHGMLYGEVHVVRCEPGLLEIRAPKDAPANLVARVSKHLMEWTSQRWMVSLTDREGEPTLADQDRAAEKQRRDRAGAHPLMQAVIKNFPTAKMTSLRRKPTAVIQSADNTVEGESLGADTTDTNQDSED